MTLIKNLHSLSSVLYTIWKYTSLCQHYTKINPLESELIRRQLIQQGAQTVLRKIGLSVEYKNLPVNHVPCLFVGNHISFLDIMVILSSTSTCFLAKEEVKHWPIIGSGARVAGTIFVKREDKTSRQSSRRQIAKDILSKQKMLTIFPSGTTSIDHLTPWRKGAFTLAKKHHIPIRPFRLCYNPLRKMAYLKADNFLCSLFNILKLKKKECTIEFGPMRYLDDIDHDFQALHRWCNPPFISSIT